MDADRFDSLTRTISAPISRRVTLSGLAAGVLVVLGLALDETSVLAKKKKKNNNNRRRRDRRKDCAQGRDRCGNRCCPPGQTCQGGQCRCAFGRQPCGNQCCLLEETCQGNQCKHRCDDGVLNLGETDTDCGRVCDGVLGFSPLGRCGLRKRCEVNEDCRNGFCREPQPGAGLQCVECLIDSHCSGRCLDNFCFQCAIDDDCPGANDLPEQRFCVALANFCPRNQPCVCRQCREDSHCPAQTPVCQLGTGTPSDGFCVECLANAHCPAARPHCQNETCFQCLQDTHCPSGQLCNENRGTCEGFECDSDDDCASQPGTPICVDGSCLQCGTNSDCAAGQTCDENGICVGGSECTKNGDCPTGVACVGGACTGTCIPPGQPCSNTAGCAADCCSGIGCVGICCFFNDICADEGTGTPACT